jgi:hypothetical protein
MRRPQLLALEVTESGVMQDAAHAIEVMHQLARIGVGRAIDDFGTGYSSLAYIKQLPVDEIKIDRSFVRNIMNDKKDMAIVLSTVELCHNLGLIVVAEGVEDALSRELLRRIGCDLAQGYLFTPPLQAAVLEKWLDEGGWRGARTYGCSLRRAPRAIGPARYDPRPPDLSPDVLLQHDFTAGNDELYALRGRGSRPDQRFFDGSCHRSLCFQRDRMLSRLGLAYHTRGRQLRSRQIGEVGLGVAV